MNPGVIRTGLSWFAARPSLLTNDDVKYQLSCLDHHQVTMILSIFTASPEVMVLARSTPEFSLVVQLVIKMDA